MKVGEIWTRKIMSPNYSYGAVINIGDKVKIKEINNCNGKDYIVFHPLNWPPDSYFCELLRTKFISEYSKLYEI